MKNITFRAEDNLIEVARRRAIDEHTTLNEQFRRWLADYADAPARLQRYEAVMSVLQGQMQVGRKLSRDEMNER